MTITRFVLIILCIMLLIGLSVNNSACKKNGESLSENNERILNRTFFWQSSANKGLSANSFTDLGIEISSAKIEETTKRDGILLGWVVRIVDVESNAYYLDLDADFWKFIIREDSLDGKVIHVSGADTDFPED